ncbi:dienelactone hydrolase family protein [Rhabdochromatium marinum]|uniref:dienelactone hydrolase family protein n=1 Tax=Rhabdochromatium marinum TaxID=48729 RepID=UPI001905F375|nr:dienelactone hydrolase family protein [Rhabdochromatium marinum]MBK1648580.1 dienelactone hydrolase [Rhabdochromatium marinum]
MHLTPRLLTALLLPLLAFTAQADSLRPIDSANSSDSTHTETSAASIHSKTVDYQDGETKLTGYLYYPADTTQPRPGVIVVHEWWGLNDYAKQRARMLAELGYVAFAIDMYGDDRVTSHAPDAKGWMQQITEHVEAWQARALAGLEILAADPKVDAERLAAVGYCFGGATVMQMAYAGADLDGVVSFHGSLPPAPENLTTLKPSVLAAHGAADAFVPPAKVAAFQQSLEAIDADWEFVAYGGARHAFTNPNAADYGIDNVAYHAKADQRSWALMQDFLTEVFAD